MLRSIRLMSLVALASFFLLSGKAALADTTFSVTNLNDGFGSSYTLSATCNTSGLCNVTLQINTTGATQPDISAAAFKIGTTDILTGTLTPPNGTWSTTTSSLNNGSCSGSNSDGQLCSQATSTGSFAQTGGTLTWSWTGVQVTGTLSIAHVGYKYNNAAGTLNGHIVSDDYGSPVPEPGTLNLVLVGLIGAGILRRRLA